MSMAGRKKLNVGMVGYGFMGRTHSNAFGKVNQFFDLGYEPVLKAVCGRDKEKVEAFAGTWNYDSCENDWCKLVARTTSTLSISRLPTTRTPKSRWRPPRRARWSCAKSRWAAARPRPPK
jgi:hypothetical protein